ncbi:MAG: DUF3995 domain-containing protein [Thermoleophilaceae bacterium]|nr:DUF3995 domain-containing protein [Thermoleophilaceae bacterium]
MSIPVPAPRFADEDDGVLAYPLLPGQPLLGRSAPRASAHLARERSAAAVALGSAAVLIKVAAGLLALALAQPWGRRLARPWLLTANGAAGAVLIVWGGANVLVGALVLGEVITPAAPVDEHALRWHVFVWDLWFLVWGVLLAVAVARHARRTR